VHNLVTKRTSPLHPDK